MKLFKYSLLALILVYFMPFMVLAQGGVNNPPSGGVSNPVPSSGSSAGLTNPLKGVDDIKSFVVIVLNNIVLPIGSVVIVIFIIYSGFLFVTARGNESQLEKAKHILLYVVIGTAILLGSVAIAAAIKGTLCQISPNLPDCPGRVQTL